MDSRDIKENPPFIEDGTHLTKIFQLQKELLDGYIKIEDLPKYPINIHIKANQLLIKDFSSRIVEELAEAHESYKEMISLQDNGRVDEMIPFLQNFNEEIADAIHFFIELLIYINIEADDIMAYYENVLKGRNMVDAFFFRANQLKTIFTYARQCNVDDPEIWAINKLPAYQIKVGDNNDSLLLSGGSKLSPALDLSLDILFWRISYHLNIARNFLKNKPWKQTQMLADIPRFQNQIMEAWLAFMKMIDYIGIDQDAFYTLYFKKNRVNKFRQESNY